MSKKKNTLKDLDAFLKQQAATLVAPARISTEQVPVAEPLGERKDVAVEVTHAPVDSPKPSVASISKAELYDSILRTIESQPHVSPEDRMLINTLLYIKNGDNWQEGIRAYWRHRRS